MAARLPDERLNTVAERASQAFWATVAGAFPEIRTGDVDPFSAMEWDEFVGKAIRRWYEDNSPVDREQAESDAVDHLAEMLGHEACDYTLKATTDEIAVHLALFAREGSLESCGGGDR